MNAKLKYNCPQPTHVTRKKKLVEGILFPLNFFVPIIAVLILWLREWNFVEERKNMLSRLTELSFPQRYGIVDLITLTLQLMHLGLFVYVCYYYLYFFSPSWLIHRGRSNHLECMYTLCILSFTNFITCGICRQLKWAHSKQRFQIADNNNTLLSFYYTFFIAFSLILAVFWSSTKRNFKDFHFHPRKSLRIPLKTLLWLQIHHNFYVSSFQGRPTIHF